MRSKKSLIILAKNIDGGTGTFLNQLLKLSNSFSIKVLVIEKPRFRKIHSKNVSFEYFSHIYSYRYNELFLWLKVIKEIFWLKKIVSQNNKQVILSIDTHANILASIMKLMFRKKIQLITTTHNNLSAVAQNKLSLISIYLLKKMGHVLLSSADFHIGVSHGVSKNLKHFFSLKQLPKTVYYGLETKTIHRLSNKAIDKADLSIFKSQRKTILAVGRFENQKDFSTLLRAFALVRKQTNSELLLIGDGTQRQNLQHLAKELAISKYVKFLGWKSNVYPYIKKADIFVLSSHYEGLPYVLIEALILGKAIVSTNCKYGPNELLQDGKSGILTTENNPEQMSKHLVKLINNSKVLNQFEYRSLNRGLFFEEEKMLSQYAQLIELAFKKTSGTINKKI